ncbi:homoserine kinase [Fischerella thermalis]|uniref:homoserine kinase n=1 Tax=Fischerella thermalis TaxID=372787 RepID=UPI000C80F02D|nr:homoserine kinase [Fischerella thermalis]PLZ19566.1 homoserine kinase [Fischerella thermalis WC1110]PLZ40414.1 homoserine kinase [Fischerella thermalis WC538]PLZ48088.1 homoserine kinase [Fischerella thermalis WC527]
MTAVDSVSVIVPATTANLGPGFDCIGAALTLYNEFTFTRVDLPPYQGGETAKVIISVTGAEAERVQTDESNLLYQAFVKLYQHLGQTPPPVEIEIKLGVPLARGLGSSATAIVGGLVGANVLAGEPLSQSQVMELAIAMEGHPDNVVPALLGGCRLAATGVEVEPPRRHRRAAASGTVERQEWEICEVPWCENIVPVVAIPDFELSTKEARQVLPSQVSRADAIFNTAHLGLLLRGLETGNGDWLRAALQDKLHQPYRKALIKGYDAVNAAAIDAGAYGMVISGAGPTLLVLTDTINAEAVATAMSAAWRSQGISPIVRSLGIDTQGARSFY